MFDIHLCNKYQTAEHGVFRSRMQPVIVEVFFYVCEISISLMASVDFEMHRYKHVLPFQLFHLYKIIIRVWCCGQVEEVQRFDGWDGLWCNDHGVQR